MKSSSKAFVSVGAILVGLAWAGICATRLQGAPPSGPAKEAVAPERSAGDAGPPLDFQKVQAIRKKQQAGEPLTPEEQAYAQRAFQLWQKRRQEGAAPPGQNPAGKPGEPPWKQRGGPEAAKNSDATAPSHLLVRGDVEILTFESEQDYDRLQELYRSGQDTACEPGETATFYLRSRTDGSVQPYAVRLPTKFSPQQTFPLVVQLHGLNFNEVLSGSRTRYRGMFGGNQWVQPELPVIYAQCFGRPSAFYRGLGEEDVLEVIDEVRRRFPVDPDRVYLMGHSMGGCGTYHIGLHFPDLFGGLTPIDPAMGTRLKRAAPGPTPDWMLPQIAIHSPASLYPNARNLPVFFKNAGAGIQGDSTEFTDGIVAQGGFSKTVSFPGLPHNFADKVPYSGFVAELIERPIPRRPGEVKFFTTTLRYNRAYWLTIDRLTRHNAESLVATACDAGRGLSIKTKNIDALTVRLDDCPAPRGGPLVVDGTTVLAALPTGELHLCRSGGGWKVGSWPGSGLVKRHGLQGPIDDAFNSRFLAVYGEGDRDLAVAELDAVRNPPGPLDIHGDFMLKAAAKVTKQDVESCNLILFGTPQSNAVLKRLAGALPAALVRSGSDGSQSVFIHPNPENPDRYVLVWQGRFLSTSGDSLRNQWILPLCLLPDYLWVKEGQITAGGHFDGDWKLGP